LSAEPGAATEAEEAMTVLGAGTVFDGLLTFRGRARVDGQLSGEIVGHGLLVIGAEARAQARVVVDELVVAGEIEGDVCARKRVELLATGCIRGDVETPRLSIAEGGRLLGRCTTGASARKLEQTPAPAIARASRPRSS
jgi:cytoskeletal protein CcmA (bactofilin family)